MRTIIHVRETFAEGILPDGSFNFLFTKVIYRDGGDYFDTKTPLRHHDPSFDVNILEPGSLIVLQDICHPLPPHLAATALVAPCPLPPDTYVKTIEQILTLWDDLREKTGKLLIEEIEIYEELRHVVQPWPHSLCEYRGYIADQDGRIVGFALKKYERSLVPLIYQDYRDGLPTDRVSSIMVQCRRAVDALHVHGYVHNDISPANIMIDSNDIVVLIDFATARKEGTPLKGMGTEGFTHYPKVAAKENDYFSLSCVKFFLTEGTNMYKPSVQERWRREGHY